VASHSARADLHRSAVLAQIGALGPKSRADLSRLLDVSPALITQITRKLISDGLLIELDNSPSRGGRPARLLGLRTEAGRAIGVKVADDHLTFVEAGIAGNIERSATEAFNAAAGLAVSSLAQLLRTFIEKAEGGPILGVGVGVPGNVVDQDAGIVDSTQLGWNGVPLGDALRHELELPVLIDNNVNALTFAERLHGKAQGRENVLIATIGTGIGAGIVAGDAVIRGQSGGAGEIGHIPVVEDGPECQCGAQGCLEALISERAIVEQARTEGVITAKQGIDVLHQKANQGVSEAKAIFARAGRLLGRTLAGVVNFFDPEIVIVLGEGVDAWAHWSTAFDLAFRPALMPHKRAIPIAVETWKDDRWAHGAASLVFATPFDETGNSGEQGRLVRARLAEIQSTQTDVSADA